MSAASPRGPILRGLWRGRESGFLDAADFAGVHLRETEALAAEVFQRGADEVEFPVVDDEETVVEGFVVADGELRVLFAECPGVGIGDLVVGHVLPVVMLRCEDRHLHALTFSRKEVQHLGRRPVVDEDQRTLRARDELQHQRPRVPQLPVVEDALNRGQCRLQHKIDLFVMLEYLLLQSLDPIIDGIPMQDILFQDLVRPLSESRTNYRFDPIANGNDDI